MTEVEARVDAQGVSPYLLLVPFFCSGAAALIAQLCWLRILTVSLGGSSTALNIILITFMAGLAIGAALAKGVCRRTHRYVQLYAVLEAALSVYILLSPRLMRWINDWFVEVLPRLGHETMLENLARLVVAGSTLILPTVVMGMTTPVLITASVRHFRDTAVHTGLLYGINTLGAATGALAAGCWLILAIGVGRSLGVAALLNLTAALLAAGLVIFARRRPAGPEPHPVESSGSAARPAGEGDVAGLLALAFAGGFCGMALEVVFARLLQFVIGGSYYSHTISIAGFLLGIVLGSLLVGLRARRVAPERHHLPVLFCLFGGATLVSALSFEGLPRALDALVRQPGLLPVPYFLVLKLGAALLLVVLPAMASGLILPYLVHLVAQQNHDVARASASVLFLNTVGSVLGVALTGYLLIEWAGVRNALFGIAALIFLLVLYSSRLAEDTAPGPPRAVGWLGVAGLLVSFLLVPLRGNVPLVVHSVVYDELERPEVVYYAEDEGASVSAVAQPDRDTAALLINGLIAGQVDRASIVEGVIADIAVLSHPDPRSLFLAGVGTGRTAGVAGLYPDLRTVAVEISEAVISALPYFESYTFDLTSNERVQILHGDARHYLQTTEERFDLIAPDVYISALTGTAYLYNQEFFELCARHLRPGGRVVLNIYLATPIDQVIAAGFLSAFPEVAAIKIPYADYTFLIGSNDPIAFPQRPWDRWTDPRIQQRLRRLGVTRGTGLESFRVAARDDIAELLRGVRPSTDDHPIVDYIQFATQTRSLHF